MPWPALVCVTERTTLTRSISRAWRGRCSAMRIPGTLVLTGRNSPRNSAGAAGLGVEGAEWAGPAAEQQQDHRRVAAGLARLRRASLEAQVIGQGKAGQAEEAHPQETAAAHPVAGAVARSTDVQHDPAPRQMSHR